MRRATFASLALVAVLMGCGDGGDDDAATTTSASSTASTASPASTPAGPDRRAFCSAMHQLQTSGAQAPDALEANYAELEANAPPEIADEMTTFLRHSRAVSAAFLAAQAGGGEVDTEAVMAALDPADRQFVEELSAAAETGTLPDGPVGAVMGYVVAHCP